MSIVIGVLLCASALVPSGARAQTAGADYQNLLNMFGWLSSQIAELRAQLYASSIQSETELPKIGSYPSDYYDGNYVAVYRVNDEGLMLEQGYKSDFHARIFSLFEKIAGRDTTIRYVQEVRIYNNADARYSAFVEEIGGTNRWILGINVADIFPYNEHWESDAAPLLIHEYAHIFFYYKPDVLNAFSETFWSESMKRSASVRESIDNSDRREAFRYAYYDKNSNDFVSDYATIGAEEDAAESFLWFVTKDFDSANVERAQKQNFFYQYPELVETRVRIRGALEL